jgi:hypothetical protein
VHDRLGRRDDEDELGFDEGTVDAGLPDERGEIGVGGVVDEYAPAERASLGRRKEALELRPARPPGEAAGDEERDLLIRNTQTGELVENGRERQRPGVDLGAGHWQRWRFDH